MKNLTVLFSMLIMLSASAVNADDFQAQVGDYVYGTLLSQLQQYTEPVPVVFALSQPTRDSLLTPHIVKDSGCRLYAKQTSPHKYIIRWVPRFLVCHGIRLDVSNSISIEETRLEGLSKFRITKNIVFPK